MEYRLMTTKEKLLYVLRAIFGSIGMMFIKPANYFTDKLNESYFKIRV